jgi:DNA polymerase-3 subunit alpha
MMFATLDDLQSAVEVLVFGKALSECEGALVADSIVTIRGRVDHKDREKTCILAQEVSLFEPTGDEVAAALEREQLMAKPPEPLRLRVEAAALPATILGELKELLAGFPGEVDVVIELATSVGQRRLRLGSEYRVTRSIALHAELDFLLGEAMVAGGISEDPGAEAVAVTGAAEALGAA